MYLLVITPVEMKILRHIEKSLETCRITLRLRRPLCGNYAAIGLFICLGSHRHSKSVWSLWYQGMRFCWLRLTGGAPFDGSISRPE